MSDHPSTPAAAPRGRGAASNPANRYEPLHVELDETGNPATTFLRDTTRQILSSNDSPDIPFDRSLNPYRGCEHGCVYCYARLTHEFLGWSAGLDFETRIMVKDRAPELLRGALRQASWRPQTIAMSGVTDPYQPAESRWRLTRGCLEVLAEFRNPVAIVTKNALVTRDLDLLSDLRAHDACVVYLSITTLDGELARAMEPRTSHPQRRLGALRRLAEAGIPTGVMVAPVIPGLTEHEVPAILTAAAEAGVRHAGYVMLRLPAGVDDLFENWLRDRSPERHRKVMERIRSLRGGHRTDSRFGRRMRGKGPYAASTRAVYEASCRRLGLNLERPRLSTASFRRPGQCDLPFG